MILADVVWPALYLIDGLTKWWLIAAGVGVEALVLVALFNLKPVKAFTTSVVVNIASATCGAVTLAIAGIALEIFPGLIIQSIFDVGTFNWGTWITTCLAAVAISSSIELILIKAWHRIALSRGRVASFVLANAITVGVAMYYISRHPPEL